MHGMDVFMLKNCTTLAPDTTAIPESNRTCTSEVLFFPQITFWRYKAI